MVSTDTILLFFIPCKCRWTTWEVQQSNKTNSVYYLYKGTKYTIPELIKSFGFIGLIPSTLRYRIFMDGNSYIHPDSTVEIINDKVFDFTFNKEHKNNQPIQIIDDDNRSKYVDMKLPTTFTFKSKKDII